MNTTKKALTAESQGFARNISFLDGDSAGVRTQDPLIKSQVLYQLSYGIILNKAEWYFVLSVPKTLPIKSGCSTS